METWRKVKRKRSFMDSSQFRVGGFFLFSSAPFVPPHSSPKWRKSARYFEIFDLLYYWLILNFRSRWTRKWVFWVISESKQCSKALRLSPVGAEILIFHFLYSIISMEGFKKVVFPKQRAPKSKIWVVQIKPYSISVAPGTLHFWASANILRVLLKLVFNLWQKFGIHFEFNHVDLTEFFWQFFFRQIAMCNTLCVAFWQKTHLTSGKVSRNKIPGKCHGIYILEIFSLADFRHLGLLCYVIYTT